VKEGKIKAVLAPACNVVLWLSQRLLSRSAPPAAVVRRMVDAERLSLSGENKVVVVWMQSSFLTTSD